MSLKPKNNFEYFCCDKEKLIIKNKNLQGKKLSGEKHGLREHCFPLRGHQLPNQFQETCDSYVSVLRMPEIRTEPYFLSCGVICQSSYPYKFLVAFHKQYLIFLNNNFIKFKYDATSSERYFLNLAIITSHKEDPRDRLTSTLKGEAISYSEKNDNFTDNVE
uniref:Uncharacterized protein n=1 Tax=Heterorhabditis bacteriophora TaxID=37862 RepID=A0A1I7WAN9_HETBA